MANTRDTLGDQETVDALVNNTLTSLEEDGITKLADYTLRGRTALTSVKFPNLTNGGERSLAYCTGLASISSTDMPNLTTVGNYMFRDCANLISVDLPACTSIGNDGFENCTKLESVTHNISVTSLGEYSFNGCRMLKSFDTSKIKRIPNSCFQHCESLNELDLGIVTNIGNYVFSCSGIGKIELPACTSLGTYTGQGNRMSTIDLSNNISISSNKFNGARALCHLILRSTTLCSLGSTGAFTLTGIANGIGWIYVPSDLVNTYKAATNWSNYADQIVAIEEYPKTLQDETITDSWSDIITACNEGSHTSKYSVGDIKYLDIGGSNVAMQLVAMNRDVLASGGTAPTTWICRDFMEEFPMSTSDTTTNGWSGCLMRSWLRDVIFPQIDSTVSSAIKPVIKTYYDYITSSTLSTTDTIFIPSAREIFGGTSYEDSGIDYTDYFDSATARVKCYPLSSSASNWWLRSAFSGTDFRIVHSSGYVSYYHASGGCGVALGFCI